MQPAYEAVSGHVMRTHRRHMLLMTSCPMCDSRRIRKVRRRVSGVYRGQKYVAIGVSFHECPDCGEKLYGSKAMRKIDAAREAAVANGSNRRAKTSKRPKRQPA